MYELFICREMSVYGQVDREHILHVILYLTGVDSSIVRLTFAVELDGTKDWLKLLQCTKLHDIREWNQLDILDE